MARPKKYTVQFIKEKLNAMNEYIEATDIPILKEFCYTNDIPSNHIYDYKEFSESIKRLIDKKEAQLEKQALKNEVNCTMAVFSLKQLGWTDKQVIEQTNTNIKLTPKERKERIKELRKKLAK